MSVGSRQTIRPPGGLLIAIAAFNSLSCILAAAFFFAAFATLGLHPCSLVGFGITAFPVGVVLYDAYRALCYRDYQASERLSRLALVFAGIAILLDLFLAVIVWDALLKRNFYPSFREPFDSLLVLSGVAAYLLITGLLFRGWSKDIQADLSSMDLTTRAAHLAALEARRWTLRELLLVVSVLSLVLGLSTWVRKAMFPEARSGAVPPSVERLA